IRDIHTAQNAKLPWLFLVQREEPAEPTVLVGNGQELNGIVRRERFRPMSLPLPAQEDRRNLGLIEETVPTALVQAYPAGPDVNLHRQRWSRPARPFPHPGPRTSPRPWRRRGHRPGLHPFPAPSAS